MVCDRKSKSEWVPDEKTENRVMMDNVDACMDRAPIFIETSSSAIFLRPIVLVEDGVAKTTKYRLRKTRKGMLRLE